VTYVVIEGPDGCGKGTQCQLLVEHLDEAGHDPLSVKEPWDTMPIGKLLRKCLKTGEHPAAHAALFLADRMALLSEMVKPAVDAGMVVVSDRSFLSTLVYQQEHHPLKWLMAVHANLPVYPDLIVLLDVDPEVGAKRLRKRRRKLEVYEAIEIQKRVRQRYIDLLIGNTEPLYSEDPKVQELGTLPQLRRLHPTMNCRVAHIDATRDKDQVHAEIWGQVLEVL